jgi:hypothetical protein
MDEAEEESSSYSSDKGDSGGRAASLALAKDLAISLIVVDRA